MADPAPTPATALSVRERGYMVPNLAGFWMAPDVLEQTPELIWPNCLNIYDAMARQDAQVSSVFRAVATPILRTQWRVDGTGCSPDVTAHVANDLGLPVVGEGNEVPAIRTRDRFSWTRHLRLALLMLRYGHSYFEQVYRLDDRDGLAHLRKLGWRPPRTIARFNVARDGGLDSIEQYQGFGMSGTVTLPMGRLVAYVHDQEGGNWVGQSLLRPAYKNWLLKDRLLRIDTQAAQRNGMGIPVYQGAPGESDLEAGQQIATEIRAGDNSGAAIPNGSSLELMGVTARWMPDVLASVKYHDEQIARAVLAHFLNLGSQTGSWALGSTFADFFTLSLQSVAEEIRDTATMHIVEDLVDLNYGPTEPAPRLVFDEIGSNREAVVTAIAQLVTAGVLHADEDLEQFIRTSLGLPQHTDGATTAAPPVPPTAPQEAAS